MLRTGFDVVPAQEQTGLPIADQQVDREKQGEGGVDWIEVPVGVLARAEPQRSQQGDHQDGNRCDVDPHNGTTPAVDDNVRTIRKSGNRNNMKKPTPRLLLNH